MSSNDIESDHQFYDQSRYEKMHTWLYYNQSERGYMCKVCEVYYGNSPYSSGSNRGAWSHIGMKFNDNPGKKIQRHKKSSYHNKAVLTNLKIQDTIEKSNRGGKQKICKTKCMLENSSE